MRRRAAPNQRDAEQGADPGRPGREVARHTRGEVVVQRGEYGGVVRGKHHEREALMQLQLHVPRVVPLAVQESAEFG